MNRGLRQTRGFTLIELMTVVAIIGVLVTLLLPAVQGCREAARRTQCLNNLMQITIALQNYVNHHGVLPPGTIDPTGPINSVPQGYHYSWIVQILPHLEQATVYSMFSPTASVYAPGHTTARSARINSLQCPSDPGPPARADGIAENNYAGCHHHVEAPIGAKNKGVLFLNSAIRYEDITDGTSHTIFVGEKPRNGIDLGWASGTRATLRNTGTQMLIGDPLYRLKAGQPWDPATASPWQTLRGAWDPRNTTLVGGFGSFHPGGANVAFGDGSVRFVRNSVSPQVYQCLGHRADGEMLDEDSY
jgi:prepilin-type N-terminal cleavage/methylation domain-containing protein/prepilin-type processing-associated H-X9-DG protein